MKNKFITTVVATALALTMTFSLANGNIGVQGVQTR